jgi:hypothetical protein
VAAAIAHELSCGHHGDTEGAFIDVDVAAPLRWVAPSALRRADPAATPLRDRFLLRSDLFVHHPAITVSQDGAQLWRGRLLRLVPGRSLSIPAAWLRRVDPAGGSLRISVGGSAFGE